MKSKSLIIVLIVTLFNLLAEYSLRGFSNISAMPLLPLLLFINYFAYFIIIEDFIGRFKFKDIHVFIAALFFGIIWQLVGPSVVYLPPTIFGINWMSLIFVNIVWWCSIQTVLPFYIANRISTRKKYEPLLSKSGLIISFVVFVLATFIFRLAASFPPLTIIQIILMLIFTIASGLWLKKIIKQPRDTPKFQKSWFLDIIAILFIIYLIYSTFHFTETSLVHVTILNLSALNASVKVTFVVFLLMLIYRQVFKKPISV